MVWLTIICFILVRVIISIGILFILHNLYDYCKRNFTTKKTKDLVSLHKEKYQEILNELHNQPNNSSVEHQPDELTHQDKAFLQQSLLTMIQTDV
jgi:ABC-type nickel/cobalt efflux system permease component RcnA